MIPNGITPGMFYGMQVYEVQPKYEPVLQLSEGFKASFLGLNLSTPQTMESENLFTKIVLRGDARNIAFQIVNGEK